MDSTSKARELAVAVVCLARWKDGVRSHYSNTADAEVQAARLAEVAHVAVAADEAALAVVVLALVAL